MEQIKLSIDGRAVSVPAGTSILEAARAAGVRIPTLCWLEKLDAHAACRVCVVAVEGEEALHPACAAKAKEGMVVHTDTEAVRARRKRTLEQILENHDVDCHHCLRIGSSRCADLDPWFCETCFFCDCVRDGFCELQALAREYEIDRLPNEPKHGRFPVDSSAVIIRDPNKCVKCRRCVDVCGKIQTVNNLRVTGWGEDLAVGPEAPMGESACIGCGRCVELCPTGALFAREHKDELVYHAHRPDTAVLAMVDGALIEELERIWPHKKLPVTVEQLVGALRKIGVSRVVDAEELRQIARSACEKRLDERLRQGPAIVYETLAARKLLERDFAEYRDRFVALPSALEIFGAIARERFSPEEEIVKTCAFVPLGPDVAEADETGCVDYAVNARELYRIMVRTGSEPHPGRLSAPDAVPHAAPSGKYGRLLEWQRWSLDREAERFKLEVDGRTLFCALCRNPAQLRKLLAEDGAVDAVRVIV